jgi:electron transfer flavoprotein alpha/beta subunit
MTIVVCVKFTPDTSQIKADPGTGAPRLDDVPLRIGTFDENALEEAVRLKEGGGGRVIVLSLVDSEPPRELVLRALATGADEACLIRDATAALADSLSTATILARGLRRLGAVDLVLCGEGSLDGYNRQVGPRLGEALGIPVLTHVIKLETGNGKMIAHRGLDDRIEVIEAEPPLILSVGQEINRPRLPTVLQIMGAARKPVVVWTPRDLGFESDDTAASLAGIRTLETFAPLATRRRAPVPGDNTGEVARTLARELFEKGLLRVS